MAEQPQVKFKSLVDYLNNADPRETEGISQAFVELLEACEDGLETEATYGSVLEEAVALLCFFFSTGNEAILEAVLDDVERAERSRESSFRAYEASELETVFKLTYSEKWILSVLEQGETPIQKDLVAAYPDAQIGWALSRLSARGMVAREKFGRSFQIFPCDPMPSWQRPVISVDLQFAREDQFWKEFGNRQDSDALVPIKPGSIDDLVRLSALGNRAESEFRKGDRREYLKASREFLALWLSDEAYARSIQSSYLGMGLLFDAVMASPEVVEVWNGDARSLTEVQQERWTEFLRSLAPVVARGRELRMQLLQQGSVLQSALTRDLPSADAEQIRRVLKKMNEWRIVDLKREGSSYRISLVSQLQELSAPSTDEIRQVEPQRGPRLEF